MRRDPGPPVGGQDPGQPVGDQGHHLQVGGQLLTPESGGTKLKNAAKNNASEDDATTMTDVPMDNVPSDASDVPINVDGDHKQPGLSCNATLTGPGIHFSMVCPLVKRFVERSLLKRFSSQSSPERVSA